MKTLLFLLLIATAAAGQDTTATKPLFWKEVDSHGQVWYNYRFNEEQQAKVAEKEVQRHQCEKTSESCEVALDRCQQDQAQFSIVVDAMTTEIAKRIRLHQMDSVDLVRSNKVNHVQDGINKSLKKERNRYRAGMYSGFVGAILTTVGAYMVGRKH